MICTRNSVTRFIELFQSIHPPHWFFFQTLTFRPQLRESDAFAAKRFLDKLRKNLQNRFPRMGAIYYQQLHKDGDLHYHVFFFFFDDDDLPLRKKAKVSDFRIFVFRAWNKIQSGNLKWQANLLKKYKKNHLSLDYALQGIRIRTPNDPPSPRKPHWWGVWNKRVLVAHSTKTSRKEVLREYTLHFRTEASRQLKLHPMTSTERSRKRREIRPPEFF